MQIFRKEACEAFGKWLKRLEKRLQLFGKNLEKPLERGSNEDSKEAVTLREANSEVLENRLSKVLEKGGKVFKMRQKCFGKRLGNLLKEVQMSLWKGVENASR